MTISRRILGVVAALGLLGLGACNMENIQAPGLAKDKEQAVLKVFTAMQNRDLSGLALGPEMNTPEAQAAIPQVFAAVPPGTPSKVRLLNWKTNWSALTGSRTESLVTNHEYTMPAGVFLVETVMSREIPAQGEPAAWQLRGFHITPQSAAGTPPDTAAPQPVAAPATPGPEAGRPADGSFASSEATQEELQKPTSH